MTNWNMRTEELELKDGSTIKNYHYEFNSTDRVFAKIVEDVFKAIMDIKVDRKTEPQTDYKMPYEDCEDCETHLKAQYGYCNECKWYGDKQVCGRCRSRNLYAPKDEPQTEKWHDDCNTCRWHDGACTIPCCDYEPKNEPRTDCSWK